MQSNLLVFSATASFHESKKKKNLILLDREDFELPMGGLGTQDFSHRNGNLQSRVRLLQKHTLNNSCLSKELKVKMYKET